MAPLGSTTSISGIRGCPRSAAAVERRCQRFAIVDAHDDHLLGQVGLGVNVQQMSAEGYYWVVASERGRGVASVLSAWLRIGGLPRASSVSSC